MQRLFNIVRLFKEYVVLALLSIISLVLLSLNDNKQIRTIRAYTISIVGTLQSAASVVPNFFALERENEILRQQNVELTDEVSRLREARLENLQLRELLKLKEHSLFHLVGADIVGKTLDLLRNTVTINKGDQDGLRINMPIVSEAGLVGRVIATSSHYSVAQLMINRDFRASVKIERSRVVGILAWNGGEFLQLKNVAKTQDVAAGDLVMTSEYSNIFPRDIKIGTVIQVSEREDALFKEIQIKSSVDFTTLEHVFVISATPDPERQGIESKVAK